MVCFIGFLLSVGLCWAAEPRPPSSRKARRLEPLTPIGRARYSRLSARPLALGGAPLPRRLRQFCPCRSLGLYATNPAARNRSLRGASTGEFPGIDSDAHGGGPGCYLGGSRYRSGSMDDPCESSEDEAPAADSVVPTGARSAHRGSTIRARIGHSQKQRSGTRWDRQRGGPTSKAFGYTYPNFDVTALAKRLCAGQGWKLAQVRFYTGIADAGDNAS